MKDVLLILIAFLGIPAMAQENGLPEKSVPDFKSDHIPFELFIQRGVSNQLHSYPNHPNYGKQAASFLAIMGIGTGKSFQITNWFLFKAQLGYLQKGSSYSGLEADARNLVSGELIVTNKFHFAHLDFMVRFKMGKRSVKPYLQSGIRSDLLLAKNIKFDLDEFSPYSFLPYDRWSLKNSDYPTNSNYANFSRVNYGILHGVGLEFNDIWFLEVQNNFDLGYFVNNSEMRVKNFISALVVGFKIK